MVLSQGFRRNCETNEEVKLLCAQKKMCDTKRVSFFKVFARTTKLLKRLHVCSSTIRVMKNDGGLVDEREKSWHVFAKRVKKNSYQKSCDIPSFVERRINLAFKHSL